ncbi:MAG: penicillin-binding transpeptidase domain-containing protein, partial [Phycisphaerae bacterium]|nr:penicillin-binding transpeptidase domain-containing protein [Phycisphaerae bacterium]
RGRPMLFRAVAGVYPPGSIVKPVVLAGALADGKLHLDEKLDCPGYLLAPDKPFKCWLWARAKAGHGELSPSDALKFSCNVFFYKLGEKLGLPRLAFWLQRFGLGTDLHTGLAEERRGIVPTPLWLATHHGFGGFSINDARNVGIGQGDLGVTPLAAATMMSAIARGGIFVYPQLNADAPAPQPTSLGVDWPMMSVIHEGMIRVVNAKDGTAHKYAFMTNVKLAGKTGSAQASRLRIDGQLFPPRTHRVAKRIDEQMVEVDEEVRPAHAWFAGFAPADKPTIAVACIVEYGMSGGEAAGPLAREVVQLCIDRGYVAASTPPPPPPPTPEVEP